MNVCASIYSEIEEMSLHGTEDRGRSCGNRQKEQFAFFGVLPRELVMFIFQM